MLSDLIYGYFKGNFPEMYPTSQGWYRFNNPFGAKQDKSSAVNFDLLSVQDWRSGLRVTTLEFIRLLESLPNIEATLKFLDFNILPIQKPVIEVSKQVEETIIPAEFLSLYEGETILHDIVQDYIIERGFTVDFMANMGCRYCIEGKFFGRLIIPYIDQQGNWQTFTGRDFLKNQEPKYKNPKTETVMVRMGEAIYNEWAFNFPKVYVNEGTMDALTFVRDEHQAVAIGGWAMSTKKKSKFLEAKTEEFVVIADRGFYKKTMHQFSFLLGHKKVKIINNDDSLGKDANEAGTAFMLEKEKSTPYLQYSDLFL